MRRRSTYQKNRGGAHVPDATIAAEARAKRARDHLARKRRQELRRRQRERGRAESASSRAKMRGIVTPLLFGLAFVSGLVFSSPLSEIFLYRGSPLERIAVQGASTLTPNAIAMSLGIEAGRSLDTLDPTKLRDAIKSEPWIESIRSLRLPGGTLIISVLEREAVARWRPDASGEVALVDDRGKRFSGRVEPGGPLPLVLGSFDENVDLPASAIEILEELRRHVVLADDPSALTLHLPGRLGIHSDKTSDRPVETRSGYVLQVGEEGPRALLGKSFLQQRVARLAALLESEESQRNGARLIDLRYADRAVLQTEPVSG
jgi:cell division septal protein FtsQ